MQMQKKVSKATQKKKTQENKKQNHKQLMVTIQKASLLLCVWFNDLAQVARLSLAPVVK